MQLRPTYGNDVREFGTGLRERIYRNWAWRAGSPRDLDVRGLRPAVARGYGLGGSKPGA